MRLQKLTGSAEIVAARACLSAMLIAASSLPSLAEATKGDLTEDIRQLLTLGNETTTVQLDGCVLRIETKTNVSCTLPGNTKRIRTTLHLDEVTEIEASPFREGISVRFEFDVAKPSKATTLLNKLRFGEEDAFQTYLKESEVLLQESDIQSNTSRLRCDGQESTDKERGILLFLDDELPSMADLTALAQSCRASVAE